MLKAKRRIRLPRSDRPAEDLRQGFMNCDRMITHEGKGMENARRSQFAFGLGTVGRAMLSPLVSRYYIYFLADVLYLPDETMWTMTGVLTLRWIFDSVKDPRMGVLVDNTRACWGRFRPWLGPDKPGRASG
ncbi:hypothetical protein SDC9_167719 [bioreactor metagenome]|uniref:Uncharacterized protein n=1 Tax=bioreactor metagenome TaxID=1076179 RepID=A0A645G0J3_9ZZZZ